MSVPQFSLVRYEEWAAQIRARETTLTLVADRLGINRHTFWLRMGKLGLLTRRGEAMELLRADIVALRRLRKSTRRIACDLNIAVPTVNKHLRAAARAGVAFPAVGLTRWTAEADARLRALIAEGASISEAGRRIGVGKNAAIARLRRLRDPGEGGR